MGSIIVMASYLFKVDGLGPFSEDFAAPFTEDSEMVEVLSIKCFCSWTEIDF